MSAERIGLEGSALDDPDLVAQCLELKRLEHESLQRWRLDDDIERIQDLLARGGVLVIPTESSYGLGVAPGNLEAVANVFALKGRPSTKGLPVVAASVYQLPKGVVLHRGLERALTNLWPAPLSLILDTEHPVAAGGSEGHTLAVRVPAYTPLLELLEETGPLTATSANRAGQPPAVAPSSLFELFEGSGVEGLLVDVGELTGGPPSTLVRVSGERVSIVRPGALSEQDILSALGRLSTGFVENSADE